MDRQTDSGTSAGVELRFAAKNLSTQDCSEKHNSLCKTPEEVIQEKDKQLARVLAQVKVSVQEWDSDKCPAVR